VRDTRRTRLLLSIAIVAALALIAVNYQNKSSSLITTARGIAGSVFGNAERAVATVTGPIGRFFGAGVAGAGGSGRTAAMQRELVRMRAELSSAALSQAEYRQLGRLLQISGRGGYRVLAASVIAYGQGYQQTVTLDAGRADGVRPQQTVLDGDGLVGQVISVSARTCTVLLATDPSSVIGIRLAPGGQVGWVTGQGRGAAGAGLLKLQVLDAGALRSGEQLVTAASVRDRPFVPGVPVGTVVAVRNRAGGLTGQALVRPYAGFGSLDVVGIVVSPPRHDPRYAVLPPKPPPSPPPSPAPGSPTASPGPSGTGASPTASAQGQAGQAAAAPRWPGRRQAAWVSP
jgi:rod shape-determining protein MreC